MPADERTPSSLHLEQELASLARRVEELEEILRRANEIVDQGLLGDLVLEAMVLTPPSPGVGPEELMEIIRNVLREELGRFVSH